VIREDSPTTHDPRPGRVCTFARADVALSLASSIIKIIYCYSDQLLKNNEELSEYVRVATIRLRAQGTTWQSQEPRSEAEPILVLVLVAMRTPPLRFYAGPQILLRSASPQKIDSSVIDLRRQYRHEEPLGQRLSVDTSVADRCL
jgi:hypothetical protein